MKSLEQETQNIAYLSLGTNLGDRKKNLDDCLGILEKRAGTISKVSGIYQTEPWGYESEHSFLNMCVELSTRLSARQLLSELLEIENLLGRKRNITPGYDDRLIDIDLLFFNDLVMEINELVIPHPKIDERRFVLVPLHDICPDLIHPVLRKPVWTMLNECSDKGQVARFR